MLVIVSHFCKLAEIAKECCAPGGKMFPYKHVQVAGSAYNLNLKNSISSLIKLLY